MDINSTRLNKKSISFSSSIVSGCATFIDTLIIFATGLAIFYIYIPPVDQHLSQYTTTMFLGAFIIFISFYNAGIYSFRSLSHPVPSSRKIILISAVVFSFLLTLGFVFKVSDLFSRVWMIAWFTSSVLLMVVCRFGYYITFMKWGKEGKITRNVAIIGAETHGTRLLEIISETKEPWVQIVGVFDDRVSRVPTYIGNTPVIGKVSDLISFVQENRVDDIVIALPWSAEDRMKEIISILDVLPVDVRLSPDMVGFNILNPSISDYCGLPVVNISSKPIAGWNYVAKSILDKTLSAIILLAIAPVMALIALGIKLDSPGPVFFKQKRYGFNNQLIEVLKFRSMRTDMQDDNAEKLATRNDPRVTKLGAFLRRTSLDELPQFINVLRGEMSIVGPRPHATQAKAAGKLYQDQVSKYAVRHKVTPGITGWAQVNGWRGETDTEEKIQKRVEYDLFYINNWSIFLDIKIILRTLLVFVNSKNAY